MCMPLFALGERGDFKIWLVFLITDSCLWMCWDAVGNNLNSVSNNLFVCHTYLYIQAAVADSTGENQTDSLFQNCALGDYDLNQRI